MPRPNTGYLYQPRGSQNWHIELQYPVALNRKRVRKSLGTPDKQEAEALALPLIAEHKRLLVDEANRRRGFFRVRDMEYRFPLGDSVLDDGTRVRANHQFATLTALDGSESERENYLTSTIVMREAPPDLSDPYALLKKPTPKKAVDNDIEHVERWIAHKNVNPYLQREAREAYRLFKELTGGKRFAAASRDDGRVLVQHLFDSGNKRATVQKKVSHLCAAVNLAIDEGKLKFNPFMKIIPNIDDAVDREPMPEEDVALIRAHRDTFKPDEWLLYSLCAATGMRREEAFQINREYDEGGIRYVIVRHGKTKQSTRRVRPEPDHRGGPRSALEESRSPDPAPDGADRRVDPRPPHPAPQGQGSAP